MSSSRLIKNAAVRMSAEPFSLASGHPGYSPDAPEDIGSSVEALEKQAYERGFSAGEKAGFEFGSKKAEVHFNGLEGLLRDLGSFRESLFRVCETEMVGLCLAIARKAVQREVEIKEDGVLECVRTALKAVVAGGEITIRVNPKEFEVVSQHRPEILRHCAGVKGMSVEPDELVARGGCAISTNYGEIDSTVTSIMHEIEEKLADAYRRD